MDYLKRLQAITMLADSLHITDGEAAEKLAQMDKEVRNDK